MSMDDIADERARQILCTDMYTSDMSRGMREAVKPYKNVCAPLPGRPAPSNPVNIKFTEVIATYFLQRYYNYHDII